MLLVLAGLAAVPTPAVYAQDRPDALAMYRNGQFDQAVQTCLDEIQQLPKDLDSYSVLGWSLLKLGRYQDAVAYGLKALAISRYDVRIIEILGEGYYYTGDDSDALGYLQQYAALAPNGDRIDVVYDLMGEIYIKLGQYNHADIALDTACYFTPNVAEWWARLGYAREMARHYAIALDAYNRALTLNPSLDDAAQGKARVEAAAGG